MGDPVVTIHVNPLEVSGFETWTSDAEIAKLTDPIQIATCYMARLSKAQSVVLQSYLLHVEQLTARTSRANELLNWAQKGIEWLKNDTGADWHWNLQAYDTGLNVWTTDKALAEGTYNELRALGVSENLLHYDGAPAPPATATQWRVWAAEADLEQIVRQIKSGIEDITAATQQAQLQLQTLMNRYNGSFEAVTASIKKYELMRGSVNNNLKR